VLGSVTARAAVGDDQGTSRSAHTQTVREYDGVMATCTHCSAELAPAYKFCVRCGTPVVRTWSTIIEVDATAPAERLPAAIRPPLDVESGPAPVAVFTWSLVGILTVIAIAAIVLALVTR